MAKISLLIFLAISFAYEAFLTLSAFADTTWLMLAFKVPPDSATRPLTMIIAWCLALITILIALAIYWTFMNPRAGRAVSLLLGVWWIGVGLTLYFAYGQTISLSTDVAKGFLVALSAWKMRAT